MKIKRVKSFTLIEILIASVIFATVAIIASSSLSMVIATNNKTDDLTSSENCVRQVSDYIKSALNADHYGQRTRVVIPGDNDNNFKLQEWGKLVSQNSRRSTGIAVFDSPTTFKIIYKRDGLYMLQTGISFNSDENHQYPYVAGNSAIHSDNCKFYTSADAQWGNLKDASNNILYDFGQPFEITRYIRAQAAASPTDAEFAKSGNRVYLIIIRDIAYRAQDAGQTVVSEDEAKNNNVFSRLDLTLSESEMSI